MPKEALQGEEVPCFALWKGVDFRGIQVQVPEGLEVKDVYNVAKGDWQFEKRKLVISKVEVNGYLGLLFSPGQNDRTSQNLEVRFDFYSDNGGLSETRRVHVFRPLLVPASVPKEIRVDALKSQTATPIVVQNRGFGTVVVNVKAAENSAAKLEEHPVITEFLKHFRSDLELGFSRLKNQFPSYTPLVESVADILIKPVDLESEHLAKLEKVADDFRKAAHDSPEFSTGIGDVIAGALIKNLHIFNVFAQFTEYFHSVSERKVLIRNPLDIFRLNNRPQRVHLIVEYTDLAYGQYPPLDIESTLVSNKPLELPLYKLLRWKAEEAT